MDQLSGRIRYSFKRLDDLLNNKTSAPNSLPEVVSDLLEFRKTVEEKVTQMREPVGMPVAEAKLMMTQIKGQVTHPGDEELDKGFDGLILRLKHETNYLDKLEGTRIDDALLVGLEKGKYHSFVRFIRPDTFLYKLFLKGKAQGSYSPMLDLTLIDGKPVTEEEMWLEMITSGQLPEQINTLHHEQIHDRQSLAEDRTTLYSLATVHLIAYLEIFRRYGFWAANGFNLVANRIEKELLKTSFVKMDTATAEVQAYSATASSPTSNNDLSSRDSIIDWIANKYDIKGKTFIQQYRRVAIAYDLIQGLRLLGVSEDRIGRLAAKDKYDDKKGTFPRLNLCLNEEYKKLGLSEEGFPIVTECLSVKEQFELSYQRYLAQKIAVEQLLEEARGDWHSI